MLAHEEDGLSRVRVDRRGREIRRKLEGIVVRARTIENNRRSETPELSREFNDSKIRELLPNSVKFQGILGATKLQNIRYSEIIRKSLMVT